MVFFYAPLDADQGFVQKIFYVHVPMAIVALVGFVVAAVFGALHLRSQESKWDMRSYVTIHLSVILAVGVLVTGSIWARASWGHWFVWDEPMLVSFLIVFLLYATYWPLRFSIEDKEKQSRYASVFAIVAGAFVPLNFAAVRMAEAYIHPATGATVAGGLPPKMGLTFAVAMLGMGLLFLTLVKYEMASKHATFRLRALRRRLAGDDDDLRLPARSAAPQL